MQGLIQKKNFSNLQVSATSGFFIVYVVMESQNTVEKMYDYNFFYKGQTYLLNKQSP